MKKTSQIKRTDEQETKLKLKWMKTAKVVMIDYRQHIGVFLKTGTDNNTVIKP